MALESDAVRLRKSRERGSRNVRDAIAALEAAGEATLALAVWDGDREHEPVGAGDSGRTRLRWRTEVWDRPYELQPAGMQAGIGEILPEPLAPSRRQRSRAVSSPPLSGLGVVEGLSRRTLGARRCGLVAIVERGRRTAAQGRRASYRS